MSPLGVIVAIVLVDLLGFTIVMPLLAPLARHYGFDGLQIGLLFAAFPLCQLVAAPILGRLSDRHGRRPVLILCQLGTALSFVALASTKDFRWMLLARAVDGALGGNILVAQAYVADVTKPEERSRGLGLIGMAFGLGFVAGPLLGGLLVSLPVGPDWSIRIPFLVAGGFSALAAVLAWAWLPESRPTGRKPARVATWRGITNTLGTPRVGRLVVVGALVALAFAALEGTFSLYLAARLGWSSRDAAFGFAGLGLVVAIVQGGMIRRLVPRFGEPRLIIIGAATLAAGLAVMAAARGPGLLALAVVLVGVGQGLASPTVSGLLSRLTPDDDQGAVFGTYTSAQTLARLVNYMAANLLLARFSAAAPFWEAAAIALAATALAYGVARRVPEAVELAASPASR